MNTVSKRVFFLNIKEDIEEAIFLFVVSFLIVIYVFIYFYLIEYILIFFFICGVKGMWCFVCLLSSCLFLLFMLLFPFKNYYFMI